MAESPRQHSYNN